MIIELYDLYGDINAVDLENNTARKKHLGNQHLLLLPSSSKLKMLSTSPQHVTNPFPMHKPSTQLTFSFSLLVTFLKNANNGNPNHQLKKLV